jgi:hypothetical protein
MAKNGDPDPISAGTVGDAARWGGSSAVVGMAANPFGAHQAGSSFRRPTDQGFLVRDRNRRADRWAGLARLNGGDREVIASSI